MYIYIYNSGRRATHSHDDAFNLLLCGCCCVWVWLRVAAIIRDTTMMIPADAIDSGGWIDLKMISALSDR